MDTASILRSLGIKALDQVPTAANYPFSIVLSFSALAAGSTVTVQDVCQRSKTFVLDELTGTATIDAAISGVGNLSTLTDNTAGTVSTTLAALPGTTYSTDIPTIRNTISSLASAINSLTGAQGAQFSYPAKSPLGDEARGSLPSLSALSVQFFSTRGDWSSTSMPWPSVIGTARYPRIPMFKPVLAGGNLVGCRITNNSTVTVSGSIVLHGRYLGAV